jgi:uncharacterized membrane protein YhaH (DUF805 family)
MEYMLMPLKKYADFSGRSRRMEYWMFQLFFVLAYIGISIITALLSSVSDSLGMIGGLLALVLIFGCLVPSLAVAVRRMHDTNHSGWWALVPIASLIFAFTDGDRGNNDYGPDPKGAGADVFS